MASMGDYDIFFWQENFFWVVCAISGLISVIAGFADHRRARRTNIEKVGYMPWTTITVLAGIASFISLIYGLASGQAL
jgi:hypothetical protein